MPFLALNSVVIPIRLGQCSRGMSDIGPMDRSFKGQKKNSTRGDRRTWDATALFQDYDTAETFIHLINGQGHVVKFGDGPTASTGLSPLAGYMGRGLRGLADVTDGFTFTGLDGDFWSTGNLEIYVAGGGGFQDCFAWDCQFSDDKWSVVLIVEDTSGFLPVVFRSDGSAFVNGTRVSYEGFFQDMVLMDNGNRYAIAVKNGIVYLSIEINAVPSVKISDIVMLPYVASDYFVAQISTNSASITTIDVASVPVVGDVKSMRYVQKPGEGIPNAREISFTLTEYLDGYEREGVDSSPVSPFGLPVLRLSGDVLTPGEGELTRIPVAN